MGSIDLNLFNLIVFESQQPQSFYSSYLDNINRFENYLNSGGVIQFHCATFTDLRIPNLQFPGGMQTLSTEDLDLDNFIVDSSHQIIEGLSNPLIGINVSHEAFENLPTGATIIVENESGIPTTVEYNYGLGHIIVTGMTWEIAYDIGWNFGNMLPNTFLYSLETLSGFWLSTNPTNGTIPAGTSVDVDILFDATELVAGVYNANIDISSNDPDEPIVTVPVELTVTEVISVDDFAKYDVEIYPNPVNEILNVSANEILTSIKVYTLLGQEVISIYPENKLSEQLDFSKLSIGTYFVKINIDSKTKTFKIAKK
jgi:hypothetical protein